MRLVLLAAVLLFARNLTAQNLSAPAGAREPAGVQGLAAFAGSWIMADDGSGQALSDTCAWLEGGQRHMICRTTIAGGGRTSQNETIYSYRGRDSTYIVNSFIGGGPLLTYLGKFDGERWVFDYQGQPGSTQRLRMLVRAEGDEIHFVEESSESGVPWQVTEN